MAEMDEGTEETHEDEGSGADVATETEQPAIDNEADEPDDGDESPTTA
jgi:hypothetical protein